VGGLPVHSQGEFHEATAQINVFPQSAFVAGEALAPPVSGWRSAGRFQQCSPVETRHHHTGAEETNRREIDHPAPMRLRIKPINRPGDGSQEASKIHPRSGAWRHTTQLHERPALVEPLRDVFACLAE